MKRAWGVIESSHIKCVICYFYDCSRGIKMCARSIWECFAECRACSQVCRYNTRPLFLHHVNAWVLLYTIAELHHHTSVAKCFYCTLNRIHLHLQHWALFCDFWTHCSLDGWNNSTNRTHKCWSKICESVNYQTQHHPFHQKPAFCLNIIKREN